MYNYEMLCGCDNVEFVSLVNQYLDAGWRLHGNLIVDGGVFYQAVVREPSLVNGDIKNTIVS